MITYRNQSDRRKWAKGEAGLGGGGGVLLVRIIISINMEMCHREYPYLLPPQGFAQKAKSRGGTLVTRAYINESTYS